MIKYKKGFTIGMIVGFFIVLSVYLLFSKTSCFSCGYLGFGYCDGNGGICPSANTFINFLMVISLPFLLLMGWLMVFWFDIGFINSFHVLGFLYLFYGGLIGYFIQRNLEKYDNQQKNQ